MPLVRSSRLLQFLVSAMVLVALLGCVPGCGASTGLATETSSGSDASGEDAGPGIEEAGSDGADLGDVESASRDGAADAAGDATLSDDGGDAGAHHDADAASSPTLVSISVTPPLETIAQSTTTRLQATGLYSDQSTADLTSSATWSSDSTSVAAVSAGVVTGVGPGTAHVSAALAGVSGQSTITVSAATVQSIAITPAMATTGIGGTVAFSATATLSNQTTQDVTAAAAWSSSTPGIASVSGGTAQGIAAGSVTITATVGTISGTAALQVSGASLTSIALTPTNPVFGANVTFPFAATGTYSDGSVADVTSSSTWLSSAPAAVSLTSGGVATTLAPGTSIVTATIGSIVGQTTVTVTAATLSSIAVAPATSTLALQGTEPLTATGSYSDGSTADLTDSVTWSSSASGTAAVSNAAGSQGTVTAVSAGTASITAALGAVSGSATVTVTPATLLWISITPATPSTPVGTTLQFTATGTYSDGSTLDITTSVAWTTDTATIATISNAAGSQGLATGIGAGTTGVRATLQSATAETTITVTAAILQTIIVTPADATLPVGDKQLMTATGNYSDGSSVNLTSTVVWATVNAGVATVSNAAGAQGLLTATGAGTSGVSATLGAIVGVTNVTVSASTLSQVVVSPVAPSIPGGEKQQFTAMAIFTNGTQQNVTAQATWSSSNATVASVSRTGDVTTLSAGTSTIGATFDGVSGSTNLTVTAAVPVSVEVSPIDPTLAPGTVTQFQATAIFSDGTSQSVTTEATWLSSSASVAGVGARGSVTALTQGSTEISATWDGLSGSSDVTVSAATVVSISVSPATTTVAPGAERQFTAEAIYSDSTSTDVTAQATWQSSDTALAGVSDAAGTRGLAKGIAAGTATISATYQGLTGTASLTVTAATVTSIQLNPTAPSVAKGVPVTFTATAIFSDNTSQGVTAGATWTSSNTGVAAVSDAAGTKGVTQTLDTGTATIMATWQGVTGSTTITVTAATLTTIQITPFAPTIPAGFTTALAATGIYSDDTTQDLTSLATWTSSAPGVAAVSDAAASKGTLSPLAAGSATVSATYQGVTGTDVVTVSSATLSSIAVTPATAAIAPFATQAFDALGTFSDGSTLDVTVYVTWLSSTPSIASVSNANGSKGVATALAAGSVTVTAVRSGVMGTAMLTVQ